MLAILLIIAIATAAILFYYHGPHSRFRRYGVKYLTPIPLFGDMGRVVFRIQHLLDNLDRVYNSFPGERFFGLSELYNPVVVIRDPELFVKITIQDFDHFQDHGVFVDQNVDVSFGRNLFSLKGQHWRDMRAKVSPMFTSAKLKVMLPFMVDASNNFIRRIQRDLRDSGKNEVDLDIKDVTSRYANDVFASSVFGLSLDSQGQGNTEFYEMARLVAQMNFKHIIKVMGYQVAPRIMKMAGITLFSKRSSEFFKKLTKETLQRRKMNNIHRPDLIEIYLQATKEDSLENDTLLPADEKSNGVKRVNGVGAEKTTESKWSESDLLAQIVGFLVAGFDVTASTMAFLTHMLALHPDVQEKLVQEIREYDGNMLDYDAIQQMPYMDMVLSEVLRMWTTSLTDRLCIKDYNLGRPNASATQDYIIRKGEIVRLLMHSFHHDPEYFPDPHKFDPGRFSRENRVRIRPGTYSPFGTGPRICIGSRFSMIEIKVFVMSLLRHMEILPYERTAKNIKLDTASLLPRPKEGHWVRLRPRQ